MKMIKTLILIPGLLAGAALAQAQDASTPMGPVNGNAENGALLFYQHGCYACHGFSGYGRHDLNHTGSPFLLNEDVFKAFLRSRQDVAPLLPSTEMPNYPANSLDDSGVSDIYAYIRSMPRNEPDLADAPTLEAILESAESSRYSP